MGNNCSDIIPTNDFKCGETYSSPLGFKFEIKRIVSAKLKTDIPKEKGNIRLVDANGNVTILKDVTSERNLDGTYTIKGEVVQQN